MSTNFDDFLKQQLQTLKIKAAYDELEPDYNIARAMMDTQIKYDLTPEQLAEKTGLPQSEIDKLGLADGDPTLSTLKKFATGMGMKLKLDFVPA